MSQEACRAPDRIATGSCDWCDAPFPEAAPFRIYAYNPEDGRHFETETLCESCRRYGPPGGSRRQRVEWAWTIEPQMSRLEKLGWWLIRRANR